MTAKMNVRWLLTTLLLVLLFSVLSCDNGGDTNTPDPGAVAPSITGLDRNAANIGDTVVISGINFGESQSGGSVRLNNMDFNVTTWSTSQISAVVVPGMVSGIVVVSSNGLPSQSGTEAQLFIPTAPAGIPLISALNPSYAHPDDVITVTGSGFGSDASAGNVFFTAAQVGGGTSQLGVVAAEVVSVDIGGSPVTQWGPNAIKVIVPWQAASGDVYVEVGTNQSNKLAFTWLPAGQEGTPLIHAITPDFGPVGTPIVIAGENFGHQQGGTLLQIGTLNLTVTTWSNTEINAIIPAGATTNPIKMTIGSDVSNEIMFTVGNAPHITGVTPSEIRVGKAFTVFGTNFGYEQGTGALMVGGTAQPISSWDNGLITVDKLIAMSATGDQVAVYVRADNDLESNTFYVTRVTDLNVLMTVDPQAGQRNSDGNNDGSIFTFRVSVTGGSGDYSYELIPDASNTGDTTSSNENVIEYQYPYSATAADEEEIDTQVSVVDNYTGDILAVNGPTVLVVNNGIPVITKMEVGDFNRGGINAPNDWCYLPADGSYHDFSFLGNDQYFTTSLTSILVGGSPLQSSPRNLEAFMTGLATSRPYGYRYEGIGGSKVIVRGLNFGDTAGELWLNVNGDAEQVTVPGGDWTSTEISFDMPPALKALSGTVRVVTAGAGNIAESKVPLVCSPYVTQWLPLVDLDKDAGILTVLGFDFQPPVVADMTGANIYTMWMVRTDNSNGLALLTHPVPAATVGATTLTFNMADLDPDGDGQVQVETLADPPQLIEGALIEGEYFFWLWTGALTDGSNNIKANSGIFSETYAVTCGEGPGPGGDPVAALTATPNTGDAPLDVHFDASGSTDDGAITKYEFRSDAGEAWVDQGMTDSWDFNYVAEGDYVAEVRVTDDEANTDTQTANVHVGGVMPGGDITFNTTIDQGAWIVNQGNVMCRLYSAEPQAVYPPAAADNPNIINSQWMDVPAVPKPDGTVVYTYTYTGLDAGSYWVYMGRGITDWDAGTPGEQNALVFGPVTLPPDWNMPTQHGVQTDEPQGGV